MAKRVTFGKPKRTRVDTSFHFGFNAMNKSQKKAFRKKHGGKGGGS